MKKLITLFGLFLASTVLAQYPVTNRSGIDASKPLDSDPVSQGAAAIRQAKGALIASNSFPFIDIFGTFYTNSVPLSAINGLSNFVVNIAGQVSSNTIIQTGTGYERLMVFTDTPTAETNNIPSGTNLIYSAYIPSNTFSRVELNTSCQVRNFTSGGQGYRFVFGVQPTGTTNSYVFSYAGVEKEGGNHTNFAQGQTALIYIRTFNSSLTNAGTFTLSTEVESQSPNLGITMMNFRAMGIQ